MSAHQEAAHHPALIHQPISGLRPYARNARTHKKAQIKQTAASIERFGFTNPVLVSEDGEIIAGHGRVEAAKTLGWKAAIEKVRNRLESPSPLGYSAKTHEAFTGFWIGAYDASSNLKPIDGARKVWTTDSGKGAVTELKYTRPAIAADALPKVG